MRRLAFYWKVDMARCLLFAFDINCRSHLIYLTLPCPVLPCPALPCPALPYPISVTALAPTQLFRQHLAGGTLPTLRTPSDRLSNSSPCGGPRRYTIACENGDGIADWSFKRPKARASAFLRTVVTCARTFQTQSYMTSQKGRFCTFLKVHHRHKSKNNLLKISTNIIQSFGIMSCKNDTDVTKR